jgi:hypothetical protein
MGRHNCAGEQVLGAGAAGEEGSFTRLDNKNRQEFHLSSWPQR